MKPLAVRSKSDASIVPAPKGKHMKIFKLFILLLMTGCATISDGPFRQVEGRPIDYGIINYFVEGETSVYDVVAMLGEPELRRSEKINMEKMTYKSKRMRESMERSLGKIRKRHYQVIEESVTLLFENEILVKKHKKYHIYDPLPEEL